MNTRNQEVREFVNEVEEIIDNIEGIKGEIYTNGLLLLLNIINMNNLIGAMLRDRVTDEEADRLDTLAHTTVNDAVLRVATLLNPGAKEGATAILCKALAKDTEMLISKQQEYSTQHPICPVCKQFMTKEEDKAAGCCTACQLDTDKGDSHES